MAINKQNLKKLYEQYQAIEEAGKASEEAAIALRKAVSKETPEVFLTTRKLGSKKGVTLVIRQKNLNVQALVAAYASMGIQANFDKGVLSLSPDDLRKIVAHREAYRDRFKDNEGHQVNGINIKDLMNASTQIDKVRAKTVRNATYYGRKGDIFYFNVTGNSKPFYRVQIRLENWSDEATTNTPVFVAVQRILAGRVSIECPCGRHQFWYRYLATIGKYNIKPVEERDFPKIRNPTLTGCCCKHVLRVLKELQSSRMLFILTKELEQERNKSGAGGTARKVHIASAEDLHIAEGKRLASKNMEALKKLIELAKKEEAEKAIKPRVVMNPTIEQSLIANIKTVLLMTKQHGLSPNDMLDGLAKTYKLTRNQLDDFMQEHGINKD